MNLETIEDYLEVLSGLQGNTTIEIQKTDCTIMYSIGRQVFRGKAMTDRQLDVVSLKLNDYKDQFLKHGYTNLLEILNQKKTRLPLRVVDRSQWIRVVDEPTKQKRINYLSKTQKAYEPPKNSYIAVRFPFNKTMIQLVEALAHVHKDGYYHERGTHIHYFKLTENAVYDIIDKFKNKDYNIQEELLEYYIQVKEIKNNWKDYVPGVYDFKLKNVVPNLTKAITKHLGEVSPSNIHLYKDRSMLYGLQHFDDLADYTRQSSVLTQRIINRTSPAVFVSSNEWHLDAVVSSLRELKRFPLLVVVPENNPLDYISRMSQSLKAFVNKNKVTTMFRLDNKDIGKEFNDYLREFKLNNLLDETSEVVYISASKKFPKPLFQSNWKYEAVIYMQSIHQRQWTGYINSDLIIHHDEVPSQIGSYFETNVRTLEAI